MKNILKIYTVNNKKELEFLRRTSKEVSLDDIRRKEFQDFLDDLIHTAKNVITEEGYIVGGLAAIQVGKDLRIFCILEDDSDRYEVLINPEIEVLKPLQVIRLEGCLSIPHTEGRVARFQKIRVTYLNRKGKTIKRIFSGYEASEIQHENDHLNGILFTDKLVD